MTKPLRDQVSISRRLLENPYAHLNETGGYDGILTTTPRGHEDANTISIDRLRERTVGVGEHHIRYSLEEIERTARNLQNKIWKQRDQIWGEDAPSDPIDILDPEVALNLIGYRYDLNESLGQFEVEGKLLEVAGVIDSRSKQVHISRKFIPNVRNFTSAHELGHALLHNAQGLHRDRPLDG